MIILNTWEPETNEQLPSSTTTARHHLSDVLEWEAQQVHTPNGDTEVDTNEAGTDGNNEDRRVHVYVPPGLANNATRKLQARIGELEGELYEARRQVTAWREWARMLYVDSPYDSGTTRINAREALKKVGIEVGK